ncbi:hypothetical protein T484DRAFT_1918480, partial [Baffinella frigidus]
MSVILVPGAGTLLAVGRADGGVAIFGRGADVASANTRRFAPLCVLRGHHDWVTALAFRGGPAGAVGMLATASADLQIRLWAILPANGSNPPNGSTAPNGSKGDAPPPSLDGAGSFTAGIGAEGTTSDP